MTDTWIGLCANDAVDAVRRAVGHIDPHARLIFASSPQDLRERVQERPFCMGVVVGPLDGAMSSLNVAAALAHDGLSADVALVAQGVTKGLEGRAQQAGIRTVIDMASLSLDDVTELDEPAFVEDELPTLLLGGNSKWDMASHLPRLEPDRGEDAPLPREDSSVLLSHEDEEAEAEDDAFIPRTFVLEAESNRVDEGLGTQSVSTRGDAPLVTFVSGRGGVGKTALVAMMATVAGSWGMNVALCDLDLSYGNLFSCFGVTGVPDLSCVLDADRVRAKDILEAGERVARNIRLWGPCERPELAELVYPKTQELLAALTQAYDLVLVDTTTTFTDAVAQAAQLSDRLVITVDDRPGSASAQARVAALAVRLGVARARIVRLANRCGPHGRGEPLINRADVGLETAKPMRVLDGGAEVGDCMAEGRMGDLVDLGSRFAESTASALAALLSELGKLPDCPDARRSLDRNNQRPRWAFGRRREAM